MRLRGSLFWGIVLILLAALLLSSQQGWIKGDIFGYFWPVVVILFGIWLLIGALGRGALRIGRTNPLHSLGKRPQRPHQTGPRRRPVEHPGRSRLHRAAQRRFRRRSG